MVAEGDRKAFYEASQWTIKQNKETLELMKEENKHFREALALLQKVLFLSIGTCKDLKYFLICRIEELSLIKEQGTP